MKCIACKQEYEAYQKAKYVKAVRGLFLYNKGYCSNCLKKRVEDIVIGSRTA